MKIADCRKQKAEQMSTKFAQAIETLRVAGETHRQNAAVADRNNDHAGAAEHVRQMNNIFDAIELLQAADKEG